MGEIINPSRRLPPMQKLFGLTREHVVASDVVGNCWLQYNLVISIARNPRDSSKFCAILLQRDLQTTEYITANFATLSRNISSSEKTFIALIFSHLLPTISNVDVYRILLTSDHDEILREFKAELLRSQRRTDSNKFAQISQLIEENKLFITKHTEFVTLLVSKKSVRLARKITKDKIDEAGTLATRYGLKMRPAPLDAQVIQDVVNDVDPVQGSENRKGGWTARFRRFCCSCTQARSIDADV